MWVLILFLLVLQSDPRDMVGIGVDEEADSETKLLSEPSLLTKRIKLSRPLGY